MEPSKFDPGTAYLAPTSSVEISISCRNLMDKDILSKSDPMCVCFHRPFDHWVELTRTETIQDNLNPDFMKKVLLEYRFEEHQHLRFELYDIDSPSNNLADHDFLGFAETTVGLVVSAGNMGLTVPLKENVPGKQNDTDNKNRCGTITLVAEELSTLKDEVTFKFGGSSIGTIKFCLFAPSIFYTISKVNEASKHVLVHRSETSVGPDPTWKPVSLTVRSLCNGDFERGLKIECFESKSNGSHKKIGSCDVNLNKLVSLGAGGGIKLIRPDGKESNSTFLVLQCKISPIFTFLDYIQSGTKLHCTFALDFTSSNGDPSDPTSLHCYTDSQNRSNPYEQAIQAVGDIIQDYDSTKTFPVLGFGARIPPNGIVSHNFPVTLQGSPYCYGLPGVLEAYRNCVRQIQFYGPTLFAPIINYVKDIAARNQNGEDYYILLIVTDGIITDMANTKEAIVNASTLPLSIIIIGVGSADFEAMEELDGDTVILSSNGKNAARDIVQFVPYRDAFSWMKTTMGPGSASTSYQYNGAMPMPYDQGGSWNQPNVAVIQKMQSRLAQEVLQEIPDQLTGFMKSKQIFPKNARN